MKISMFASILLGIRQFETGRSFTTSPMDKRNVRKEVEVTNAAEIEAEMKKFAEELKALELPFMVGYYQVRGSRAFSGFKQLASRELIVNQHLAKENV